MVLGARKQPVTVLQTRQITVLASAVRAAPGPRIALALRNPHAKDLQGSRTLAEHAF